jgi:hypothetical protein
MYCVLLEVMITVGVISMLEMCGEPSRVSLHAKLEKKKILLFSVLPSSPFSPVPN